MRHHLVKVLPYAADDLLELVFRVEAYPAFIPWITQMRVWNARDLSPGVSSLDAEASVGFSFLTEKFTTRVERDVSTREVRVSLLNGPFRHLRNHWRLTPDPRGARLEFEIDFEFKSKMLELVLRSNFDRAVAKLIGCFEEQAKKTLKPIET